MLSPDALRALAHELLSLVAADTMFVQMDHTAIGATRVARGRVRMQESGDRLRVLLRTRLGQRAEVQLHVDQIDPASLGPLARYLDRLAREQVNQVAPVMVKPIVPRTYLPNTTWYASTAAAFNDARHAVVAPLVTPVLDAGFLASAFVGVLTRTIACADKRGVMAAAQETDSELVVTGWTNDGKGAGWAGQAARDWNVINPGAIAERAIHFTRLSANPVAFEPGRYVVILDRPAVAQLVKKMGQEFDARSAFSGDSPLSDPATRRPHLNERIMDPRITLSSDPKDPEGGLIPFDDLGYPVRPMTWIDRGVLTNLAYDADFAVSVGYANANPWPRALRMDNASRGGPSTVEEMIANCKRGIYVNRFAAVHGVEVSGMFTGVTQGGCFLVRNGKIEKPIKNLRFRESPWFAFNRVEAIGATERTAFGYSPSLGDWPIAPTIVPPMMIRDFNFTALADAI